MKKKLYWTICLMSSIFLGFLTGRIIVINPKIGIALLITLVIASVSLILSLYEEVIEFLEKT